MFKIAYFSPLPPAPTGIADYSRELLSPLSEVANVTLFAERPSQVDAALRKRYQIESIARYPEQRWAYDLALYHMGNSGYYHATIYEMALRYPGVVVLHEVVLSDFMEHVTLGRGDFAAYAREIGYELGPPGYDLAWQIRLGRRPRLVNSVSFSRRLIDRSLGIIVHSHDAAGRVGRQNVERPVAVLPLLAAKVDAVSLRHRLALPDRTVLFATTGLVNANKRIDLALDAFARLKRDEPDTFFLIVGSVHTDVNLPRMIRQRHLQDSVHCTGRVAMEEFNGWTAAADVVITLRHPTLGEASGAAVRALAAGKPIIVFDDGWYGELPAEICLQIPPMDIDALTQAMLFMTRQPGKRLAMGLSAAAYAREHLDQHRVAGQYARFMDHVLEVAREPVAKA